MTLKYETQTVRKVDSDDIDELINNAIPNLDPPFECVACEEWNNDSEHTFTVTNMPEKWDKKEVKEIKATGRWGNYKLGAILNVLCEEGQIEPGEYLISVCW
jgi:hypothetical protein